MIAGEKSGPSPIPLICVLVLFVILGIGYLLAVPLWEFPDEPSNFSTSYAIAKAHKVPTPLEQPFFPGVLLNSKLHPPGYFVLMAGLVSMGPEIEPEIQGNPLGAVSAEIPRYIHAEGFPPDRFKGAGFLRFLRAISLVLGMVTLVVVWRIAKTLVPGNGVAPFLAVAAMGLTPTFIFSHAAIDPLPLSIMVSTLTIYQLLHIHMEGKIERSRWRKLGLLLFLGIAIRATLSFLYLPSLALILKEKKSERRRLTGQLITPSLLGLIWMLVLSPGPTILAYRHLGALLVKLDRSFLSFSGIRTILIHTKNSFWARFGWADLYAPARLVDVFDVLTVLIVFGWGVILWRRRQPRGSYFIFSILALGVLGYFKANVGQFDPQGRFLQLLIGAYAPLVAVGLIEVIRAVPRVPQRWITRIACVFLPLVLVLVNLYALSKVIMPAYAAHVYTELDLDAYQEQANMVWGGNSAGQTFLCRKPGLTRVELYITPSKMGRRITLEFRLATSSLFTDPLVVARAPYPGPGDSPYVGFQFTPRWNSKGRSYYVEVKRVPEEPPISAWYTLEDRYMGGSRYAEGTPARGDLRFTTYCASPLSHN